MSDAVPRRLEIALRICQCTLDTIGFGLQFQQRGKLRLATGTPVIDDQMPRDRPSHVRAQVLFDHG